MRHSVCDSWSELGRRRMLALDCSASPGASSTVSVVPVAQNLRPLSSGLLGQAVRFGLAGSVVTLVYLATTTVLAEVVGTPFQAALAVGFCAGLIVHFTLQRVFVWTHHDEFALPLHHQ